MTTPLALAVEVLSPSSRSIDHVLKREMYEQAGVLAYWIVDPSVPSVTVWELADGTYGEALLVTDTATLSAPFVVSVNVADLGV